MAYPRFQRARDFKFITRTSGNMTLNSTSWANVDNGLDIVLVAQAGDVIEVGGGWLIENQNPDLFTDVATIVSGIPVNYFGTQGAESATSQGIHGWYGLGGGVYMSVGGGDMKELVSGDISSGTVTLRLRYRTLSAANRVVRATADNPFRWWAKNLGPKDPN